MNCLSDAENKRMESFTQRRHRDQYYLSHVILRIILGKHMKCDPKAIDIVSNTFGKPYIRDSPEFQFNLSHTDGAIALGIANNFVGVDIENTSSRSFPEELYSRIFTEEEKSSLFSKKASWRSRLAFRYWTRKEAIAKADGRGLSLDFRKIQTAIWVAGKYEAPGYCDGRTWFISSERHGDWIWSIASLEPSTNIVVQYPDWRVFVDPA
jgi:4'-phosphopantetheinyl transferase